MNEQRVRMNERKLKAKLIEMGETVESVSNKLRMNTSTFYRKFNNNGFSVADVQAMILVLNLSENDIMEIFFENYVA